MAFELTLQGQGIEVTDTLRAQVQVGCRLLSEGTSPEAVALGLLGNSDLDLQQSGFVIGAGVVAYCPEHRDLVES